MARRERFVTRQEYSLGLSSPLTLSDATEPTITFKDGSAEVGAIKYNVSGDKLTLEAGTGGVVLNHNGTDTVETTASGLIVNGTIHDVAPGADSNASFRVYNTQGGVQLRVNASTGVAQLRQASSAGAGEDVWIAMNRNGTVELYKDNTLQAETSDNGLDVYANATGTNPSVQFYNSDLSTREGFLTFFPSAAVGARLRSEVHGGNFRIEAEDAGGVVRTLLELDPDNVSIGFNGSSPTTVPTYTPTNVVTDRSYDANATTTAELADVLGTLIADLQALGLLN